MQEQYSATEFEARFHYSGTDLGAVWSPAGTAFRVWAPTAQSVTVNLYHSGNPGAQDLLQQLPLSPDEKGTWYLNKAGDLGRLYYTYLVTVDGITREACDPYAVSTGTNGQRAMILDLCSTDPDGWEQDRNPNPLASYTDAVLYELHVRDFSVDPDSGICHKGKFLGLAESGTTTVSGIPTGLDHLRELGVTHLHLLPVFDYGSVDERLSDPDYNWGYDPVNFNVPEGSYCSDPSDGAVRVREMKQMIKKLHDNGLSVVMDVVYNHVYDMEHFCFNQIVPGYFSRINDGIPSNGSGCGNDTASERSMVRKYIVDSVCYWAREYHIDGFRFDLAGLLDVDTINEAVSAVHAFRPDAILYGEGWTMDTLPTRSCKLATQKNSGLTPGFAYFNDTLRDCIRGSIFAATAPGYVAGGGILDNSLEASYRGLPCWSGTPCQSVNYVSCHDNFTLLDRISLTTPECSLRERIWMNKLAAAICITAQGIPFLHAGEEMLRSKPDGNGGYIDNSYHSPDIVNSIKWDMLDDRSCRDVFEYYKGLIAFRKAHPALRMRSSYDVLSSMRPIPCENIHVRAFHIRTEGTSDPASEIFVIFNSARTPQMVPLPEGHWQIFIDHRKAGAEPRETIARQVTLAPISAMVLAKEPVLLNT